MMKEVLVTGAGKIGTLIACLLSSSEDYKVHIVDVDFHGPDIKTLLAKNDHIISATLDVSNQQDLMSYIKQHQIKAVISSLPYFLNINVAHCARETGIHYFDLTEDTQITSQVQQLAEGQSQAFVPQCGLAPGFISIVANDLMKNFDQLDAAKLRVGALPQNSNNALHYALTWSTEGVINEYGNVCEGIESGEKIVLQPLEGLEQIQLDGLSYEAFNTSGGLGSLAQTYRDNIQTLNYKTVRYPGHCEKMRVLMNDLKLNQDRETLKNILEKAIPKTYQDIVLVYVSVSGYKQDCYIEENFVKKMYPQTIQEVDWSAIQVSTASGVCAVADMVLSDPQQYHGLVLQEQIDFNQFLQNRFGRYYQ